MKAGVGLNGGHLDNPLNNLDLSTLSIPSVRLSDVVDILLVAVIIYMVLIWVILIIPSIFLTVPDTPE